MKTTLDWTECYAVPGEDWIIDGIHPETGLTLFNKSTSEQILAENPQAVRMTYEHFAAEKAKRQNTPVKWDRVSPDEFNRMLEVLPPVGWRSLGFLVGEPEDHDVLTGKARFRAYVELGPEHARRYYRASRPMTAVDFVKVTATDVEGVSK